MNVKKAFLIFLAVVAVLFTMRADCGISGQTSYVYTEAELDEFSDCDSIHGSIFIENTTISYLTGLSNLEYVEGDFTLAGCTSILYIDELSNLEYIGGSLIFQVVFTLQNIDGLSSLEYVGGDIIFDTVISIPNLDGLSSIEEVNGDLLLIENHVLENIDGLSNITSIAGDLYIGSLNNVLTDVSGLDNLEFIGGDLYFNFPVVTSIDSFSSLTTVTGDFTIENCTVMAAITGFENLEAVGGDFLIQNNPIMVNTDGLLSLNSVGNDLIVVNNPSYFSCCGLYPILNIGNISGDVLLEGNATNCNNNDLIVEDCTVETEEFETNIFVTKRIQENGVLLVFNSLSDNKNIKVYSLLGQLIYSEESNSDQQVLIPLSQSSIYLIDIRQGNARKVIRTYF